MLFAVSSTCMPLPYEIIDRIFSYIGRKADLVRVCCTNRTVREIAERQLYRVITISCISTLIVLHTTLLRRPDMKRHISDLRLCLDSTVDVRGTIGFANAYMRIVCRFLSALPQLKSLTLNCKIDKDIQNYFTFNLFTFTAPSMLIALLHLKPLPKITRIESLLHHLVGEIAFLYSHRLPALTVLPALKRLTSNDSKHVVLVPRRPVEECYIPCENLTPMMLDVPTYLWYLRSSSASLQQMELAMRTIDASFFPRIGASLPQLRKLTLRLYDVGSDVCQITSTITAWG
ncbi:hypothetical protein CALVIDRAFT_222813 [Calocera viscosa TUFC12733]|uniref:F-box domain-containing protein n=1 Tax=Calocera viscosa (strain TUFC12733) TaxID=1330018 RepID=A0A167K6Q3_CALVF|nr:hypothetical protein CALVIDRAFT_222813 [Calocera viscosa TUFC12733]